jgi:hypothetical protein
LVIREAAPLGRGFINPGCRRKKTSSEWWLSEAQMCLNFGEFIGKTVLVTSVRGAPTALAEKQLLGLMN